MLCHIFGVFSLVDTDVVQYVPDQSCQISFRGAALPVTLFEHI